MLRTSSRLRVLFCKRGLILAKSSGCLFDLYRVNLNGFRIIIISYSAIGTNCGVLSRVLMVMLFFETQRYNNHTCLLDYSQEVQNLAFLISLREPRISSFPTNPKDGHHL